MSAEQDKSFYTPSNLKNVINDIKLKIFELSKIVFVNGNLNTSKEIEEERSEFFALNKDLRKFEDILRGVQRQIRQDSKDPVKRKEFFRKQNQDHERRFYQKYYDNLQKKLENFNSEKRLR